MGKVSYQTRGEPAVEQLLNTAINPATLAAGDGLIWDATNEVWINGAGGGGGGIIGIDDDVVFKQGGVGNTYTNGISRNAGAGSRTMVLDTTNKRVSINGNNPVETLEVNGAGLFKNGVDDLKADGNELGIVSGTGKLKLFSNNDTSDEASTMVDGAAKSLIIGGTCRTREPGNFDAPNSSEKGGIYKIKLQDGTTRQLVATPAFDIQEPFRPLAFPTGQVVEYQNKIPLQKPIIIGRNLGPQVIVPAGVRVITSFGTRRNAPFFDDGMHYDPCNMRAKLTGGVGWNSFGAPYEFRVADLKLGWTIKWNIHATWTAPSVNRGDVYIVQYRNGAVLYNHLVQQLEQEGESWWIGSKTFMGWDITAGEDFDPLTDYYEVELANLAAVDLVYNSCRVEAECWLAQ